MGNKRVNFEAIIFTVVGTFILICLLINLTK